MNNQKFTIFESGTPSTPIVIKSDTTTQNIEESIKISIN